MDETAASEAAREMEKVHRALYHARELLVSVDQARAALELTDRTPAYSPLRTLVEQAQTSAERVHDALRDAARADRPAAP